MRKLVLQKIEQMTWDETKGVHNFLYPEGSKLVGIVSSVDDPSIRLIMLDECGVAQKYYFSNESDINDKTLLEIYEYLVELNTRESIIKYIYGDK
jgi:hypothetical protein